MNRYVALARVSSREQEREGFSLDVQEDALKKYAERNEGRIVKLYRIAETASKKNERKTFKEMMAYCQQNAAKIDGLLFYKVDRAARNLFDYVELERLESEYYVPVVYVTQPTENSPAGRMQRRILANMAAFYTEQQSIDVKEGHERRVKNGLFAGKAPYGYLNKRVDGRSIVEVDPIAAEKVKEIFRLYAWHNHTLDSLQKYLSDNGISYIDTQYTFTRSKLHSILRDRAYIGEVFYQNQWHEGEHDWLVDFNTFSRVQTLLGDKTYKAHTSVYGADMIKCEHCGRSVVVEVKTKQTKTGPKEYRYYRCAGYNKKDHPKTRVNEASLDEQILQLFRKMKIQDEKIVAWIKKAILLKSETRQRSEEMHLEDLQHQHMMLRKQRSKLLNMRMAGEIDKEIFSEKDTELRDQISHCKQLLDASDRQNEEESVLALKAFELSQHLEDKWINAEIPERRQILEIICLNFSLADVSLEMTIRKPFDILIEGPLVLSNRGERI